MKGPFVRLLAVIGAFTLLCVIIACFALFRQRSTRTVPRKTVLVLALREAPLEEVPQDVLSTLLLAERPVMRDIVEALERGASDDRVVGLLVQAGGQALGVAQAQELRDAILHFRAAKKFAYAFAETFGEFGPGTTDYYLATACEQIWLQPSGDVGLTGAMLEVPFLRGTLDKLGVVPRLDHRHEYKNAMNTFTDKKFNAPFREAMERVLQSIYGQIVAGIAEARQLGEDRVREIIDRGPYLGKEALDAKLVDHLGYRDEAQAAAKKQAGEGAELLSVGRYLWRAGRPHEEGPVIALIYGVGGVQRGKSSSSPASGVEMGSDSVAGAFRAAIADEKVKAILFRVDSPGGSYVASDAIWRETVRAKLAGKPVIVSMGNVAGSGGYFVAMAADKIVAQPATITGSIGVLGGKAVTAGLWDKLGLSWDEVHAGANATMWTSTKDYTATAWARVQAWLDRVYADFTSKVAEGRKLPKERVLEIAKGRIWTGQDAKAHGLVDELGGFPLALSLAKKAAGIPEGAQVHMRQFPRRKGPLERLLHRVRNEEPEDDATDGDEGGAVLGRTWARLAPVLRQLGAPAQGFERQVLAMPPIEIGP